MDAGRQSGAEYNDPAEGPFSPRGRNAPADESTVLKVETQGGNLGEISRFGLSDLPT